MNRCLATCYAARRRSQEVSALLPTKKRTSVRGPLSIRNAMFYSLALMAFDASS